jgi:hypothetical protein
VKRTEIAVRGAPATSALRLELEGSPGEDGLMLQFLHDERQTGSLARVFAGQIGLGEVSVPVAVKLQRDMALSQEDRGSVAAKFDKERNVHRRLQDCDQEGDAHQRIVRQLEVWSGPAEHEADSLEPCILCSRARHGLTPRCPECQDADAVLEELQLTDDHGLRCSHCHRQFWSTPKTRDAILDATLRRDPACRGCSLEHSTNLDGCRHSAVFLSFFRNRVLLLERMDLDLDDYLRWKRNLGSPGPRQAAQQAFETHVHQLENRRNQLQGPSVAKIADLKLVADLFSEIMAGVEHLHRHGIAHLDLKPANVCVRFRGADLDVKIIDLGLSDDPNTLAYLRQAEGPLSLWTDFSAPEFRKPRSRPLEVAGRFQDDACELDWPRPQTPTLDVPVPGDVLFFDDRDLAKQPFRTIRVVPGRDGWLVVQARLEPQHGLWVGQASALAAFGAAEARRRSGLGVVLEKHCGFPADVFSLGMLLLGVLAGHPDVGDFREALPGLQIELEEHLRGRPLLPSRALVQQLLSEPSKHLQVFHSYAQRLGCFGVAQPLAEELLGLVLRATLRGDTRVFYLADRGGDAMAAMRRFRADLDAVRNALGNALTTAQAVGVHEARLAALDQLRGSLQGRLLRTELLARSGLQVRLLYPALDLGIAGEEYQRNELAYLPPSSPPGPVLDRWERELSGQPGDQRAAGRGWGFLLRYCRRLDLSPAWSSHFLEHYRALLEQVGSRNTATEPTQAEERDRLLLWLDEFQSLAERISSGPRFLAQFGSFLPALRDKLLTPWDRALKAKYLFFFRRNAAQLPLSRGERVAIRDQEMKAALDQLEGAVSQAVAVGRNRAQDFDLSLQKWRSWCAERRWLDALHQLEADAIRQRQQVEAECAAWDKGWTVALGQLRDCLTQIQAVLSRYDQLPAGETASEELTVRLIRVQRQAIDLPLAQAAAAWVQENWPGPIDRVEALLALWQFGIAAP